MTAMRLGGLRPGRELGRLAIRDGTPGDAAEVERVHQESREAAYAGRVPSEVFDPMDRAERLARWREWLGDAGIVTLVGEAAGILVGFCTLRASSDSDTDPHTVAEMPTLYVDPAAWRQGYGKALCNAAEARAARLGFTDLVLWVLELNSGARRFYASLGFEHDGATKMDDGPIPAPLLAMRYRKRLPARRPEG